MTLSRSHAGQYAHRVNRALDLLGDGQPPADAARVLARDYDVSVRQAWRYVREATAHSERLDVPEPKVVFTVKLPASLLQRVRATAASHGKTLSALVGEALEDLLRHLPKHPGGG